MVRARRVENERTNERTHQRPSCSALPGVAPFARHTMGSGLSDEDAPVKIQASSSAHVVPPLALPQVGTISLHTAASTASPLESARLKPQLAPLPGMPVPAALSSSRYHKGPPDDANWLELLRDGVLNCFAAKRARRIFLMGSVLVLVAVLVWGAIVAWAFLGLFLGLHNGWSEYSDECVQAARRNNHTLDPHYLPPCDPSCAEFCTLNQFYFNASIKAFVIIFSYINFLPIPWRLSILHHVFCSRRASQAGVDFYGRPCAALWFNIPRRRRRTIAMLLNAAYLLHFLTLAMHIDYWTYYYSQQYYGALAQNLPFVTSIGCAIGGGVMQAKAEDALIKAHPDVYPPRPAHYIGLAVKRWWRGEEKGGLRGLRRSVTTELTRYRADAAVKNFSFPSALTGIELTASQEKSAKRLSAGAPADASPCCDVAAVTEITIEKACTRRSRSSSTSPVRPSLRFSLTRLSSSSIGLGSSFTSPERSSRASSTRARVDDAKPELSPQLKEGGKIELDGKPELSPQQDGKIELRA